MKVNPSSVAASRIDAPTGAEAVAATAAGDASRERRADALSAVRRLQPKALSQRELRQHVEALLGADSDVRRVLDSAVEHWVQGFPGDARRAVDHLLSSGGKRLRPLLSLLAARAAGGNRDLALPVAVAVELLHNGTLLHDDVIDEAPLRRSVPAAHSIYGNALAVIAGDFCYFAALDSLLEVGDLGLMARAMDVARQLATGELQQLERRGSAQSLDEAAYFRIIGNKTAALFAFATWGGAQACGAPESMLQALDAYGRDLGLAFQVVDDVLDFAGDEALAGKSLGHDLEEGMITLPLAYAMQEDPELNREVGQFIENRGQPEASPDRAEVARQLVKRARSTRGIQRAIERAVSLTQRATEHLSALPPSRERDNLEVIARLLETRVS